MEVSGKVLLHSNVDQLAALDLKILSASDLSARDPGFDPENFAAGIAVCPRTVESVQAVMAWCASNDVSIVTQGGRTGLSGGAISASGQLVVMMERMNQIREIDADSLVAVVEAGVTLSQLEVAVKSHGLTVGIDFGARGSCTIGGMVATNAGGEEAFRNGVMRQRVLGLEAVLPDGTVLGDLKKVMKANEGYDVKQMFIGAEGTLGIVTAVVLKLEVANRQRQTVLAAAGDASSALAFYHRLRRKFGSQLLATEIMWRDYFETTQRELGFDRHFGHLEGETFIVADIEGGEEDALLEILEASLEACEISDALLAKNEQERNDIWLVRKEAFVIDKLYPGGCWFDISIPLGKLDAFYRYSRARILEIDPELGIYAMGHLGDGNLHYTIAKDAPVDHLHSRISEALYTGLAEIGGSFSAEHGIGIKKREELSKFGDPAKQALMIAIKKAIDPQNIMNPGKVLPPQ